MIYLARHGQTQWNVEKRICGRADVPLTTVGRRQAQNLVQKLSDKKIKIDRIIVSPLCRAQETALIVNEKLQLPLVTDERLIEMDFGVYDGKAISTPDFQKARLEFSLPFPNGESILDVASRVYPLLSELENRSEQVLLVCHNAVSRVVDNYFHGKNMQELLAFNLANTEIKCYEKR
ncbi:histidine phosphatase family protein [Enterococcus dispar]|uniref:histidine phosphatase family protein n=1 Tax=Enterococcus dispar TaxID=44009 RepID=UPI002491C934|nr:histidine phosphatase family protein [Enterococcus dispar]